jgi:hypothetical protein
VEGPINLTIRLNKKPFERSMLIDGLVFLYYLPEKKRGALMKALLFFLFSLLLTKISSAQELRISTNFEGGSARLITLDKETQTIRITPAGHADRGMPNWWYLKIEGINVSRPLVVEVVAREDLIADELTGIGQKISTAWTWPERAAISTDQKAWKQTEAGSKENDAMVYRIHPDKSTIWLAWGPPFTPADATAFVAKISKASSFAKSFILCQSLEGRDVPALRISEGKKLPSQRPAIWINARQHAWECGGSWVGVGLINWLVSSDPQAMWLRQNAEIFFVPIMDIDHVATGDGGKHARPQDHNLDWSDKPHWAEIAAAQKHISGLAKENRMNMFLDLHNPASGNKKQTAYVIQKAYMPPNADSRKLRFVDLMIEEYGELKQNPAFPPASNPAVFHRVSVPWVLEHSNSNTIAFCIETPWNLPAGTIEGYAIVGQKLGSAVQKLLFEESK